MPLLEWQAGSSCGVGGGRGGGADAGLPRFGGWWRADGGACIDGGGGGGGVGFGGGGGRGTRWQGRVAAVRSVEATNASRRTCVLLHQAPAAVSRRL